MTPLLHTLALEETGAKQESGTVQYDGKSPTGETSKDYKRSVGLVVKNDTHIAISTVYETLYFSARLRLPNDVPDRIIRYRVRVVEKLLGIKHTERTIAGNAFVRGISGGEKRRLGFGLEMVAGHSVILADLPTNG